MSTLMLCGKQRTAPEAPEFPDGCAIWMRLPSPYVDVARNVRSPPEPLFILAITSTGSGLNVMAVGC